jgi:hypothetical protein
MAESKLPLEKRDNTIGLEALQKKQKALAKLNLELGKEVEKSRRLKGFIWVGLGKTQKQINPKHLKRHLLEKWFLI